MLADVERTSRGVTEWERARIGRILNAWDLSHSADNGVEVREPLIDAGRQQADRHDMLRIEAGVDMRELQIAFRQQRDHRNEYECGTDLYSNGDSDVFRV